MGIVDQQEIEKKYYNGIGRRNGVARITVYAGNLFSIEDFTCMF